MTVPNNPLFEKWLEENFPILTDKLVQNNDDIELESNITNSLQFCLQSLIIMKIEEYLQRVVAPKFWLKFRNKTNCSEKQGFQDFTSSVHELYIDSTKLLTILKKLEKTGPCKNSNCMFNQIRIYDYFKLAIRGTLLSQIPLDFTIIIEHFYKTAFNVFCNIEAVTLQNSLLKCNGCEQLQSNCQCQQIVDVFHQTNKILIELGLLERLIGSVLTSLIHIRIESHVKNACNRAFTQSQLKPLENWLETIVMNWLIRIYSGGSSRSMSLDPKVRTTINTFKQKLVYFLYETYTKFRVEQLFNIIIEYPESKAAIDDLRICLERTNLRKYMIRYLQNTLKTRLLHPGVSTPDILTAYIAAIKALRQLDPTGILLETITDPIKVYLREREDTVRCVVSGLLDESTTSDLADELVKGDEHFQLNTDCMNYSPDENEDWEGWNPDPIDANPQNSLSSSLQRRRVSDIISMLVNVYGSQDLFVNEYRTLLADRLLSQLNYNTEREIRQLELLKRRFGENQLHQCEVMIKDISDSRKIDENIQSDSEYSLQKSNFSTSALILSAQFWPPFKEDQKLKLPLFIEAQLEKYVKAFEKLKGSRTLCWKSHLGNVNLDIETKDRKLNLNVTPVHATIIIYFQEKNEWSLDELAEVMHVPSTILRRKISYWVSQGLLNEKTRDNFVLQEELNSSNQGNSFIGIEMADDEEIESAMASASDQREEELQVFWSYIVGMLTNLDSMPLERIHQMLKMFASQGSGMVECSMPELRTFLDKKVREHQLLFSANLYKLPKP